MIRPSFGGAKGEEGRFRADVAQAFARLSAQIDNLGTGSSTPAGTAVEFLATEADGQALSSGSNVIICTTETVDTEDAHDTTTGEFTAPESGLYAFHGHAQTSGTSLDATNSCAFLVNGSALVTALAQVFSTGYHYFNLNALLYLTEGDVVAYRVNVAGGSSVEVEAARFAGALLLPAGAGADGAPTWADITSKPTTVAGFGITNAYTKTEVDTLLAGVNGGDPLAIHVDTTDMDVIYTANCHGAPSGSVTSLSADSLRLVPFIAPARGGTIDQIGVYQTGTLAGNNFRLGIYASKAFDNIYPGELLFDSGDISTVGTGVKTAACDIDLEPGRVYWLAILGSGTFSVYGFAAANASPLLGVSATNYSTSISFLSKAQGYGALPDPAPASLAATGGNVPRLSYRFSA